MNYGVKVADGTEELLSSVFVSNLRPHMASMED